MRLRTYKCHFIGYLAGLVLQDMFSPQSVTCIDAASSTAAWNCLGQPGILAPMGDTRAAVSDFLKEFWGEIKPYPMTLTYSVTLGSTATTPSSSSSGLQQNSISKSPTITGISITERKDSSAS